MTLRRVLCRADHARQHPGLHVQPGGGGKGQHRSELHQSIQQSGARSGVHRQPAEDSLPPPARVSPPPRCRGYLSTARLWAPPSPPVCWCVSAQVKVFVTGLFSLNQDIPAFKEHLRDFLVQIKVSHQRKVTLGPV